MMQLDSQMIEKLEALSVLLNKRPEQILNEALDQYLQHERNKQVEDELEEHKKETNLSYDEFWDELDFDE